MKTLKALKFGNLKIFMVAALLSPSFLWGDTSVSSRLETIIEGQLKYSEIEGGVWTLKNEGGEVYDLHGDVTFKDGDRVRIKGIAPKGMSCVHMVGTIFIPTSIELLESARVETSLPSPPLTAPATWKLAKGTFTAYGAGGEILWQKDKVKAFKTSEDGRVAVLVRRIDPQGGKKKRDYAVVFWDGAPILEFYDAPLAVTFSEDASPYYLSAKGRFGWVQDSRQTIFFDTLMKSKRNYNGEGFAEISDQGAYRVWGMKFGRSFTMLRHEGKF